MSLLKLILQHCHELSHIETSVKYAADWILLYKQEGSEETPETAVFGLFISLREFNGFCNFEQIELIIKMVLQMRLDCRGVSRTPSNI